MAEIYGDQNPANVNDILSGTPTADQIYGLTGNDEIYGLGGSDNLYGGDGNDTIYGGLGNDFIRGGSGQDYLDGGDGSDYVDYTTFNGDAIYNLETGSANLIGIFSETMLNFERIYAGGGNDLITGTAGDNQLYGGAGNDTIYGGAGSDTIYGEAGDDTIQGGLGQDYLNGGDGNDTADYTTFNGGGSYDLGVGTANLGVFTETMLNFENIKTGDGIDIITGTAGNNQLFGGAGNDTIYGGDGNDYIQGGLGQDYLDGGDGNDTVDYTTFNGNGVYDLGAASLLSIAAGSANLGVFTETMLNFENINTGAGNDTVYGTWSYSGGGDLSYSRHIISTGAGDDTVYGFSGRDIIYGGAGNDTIYGGNSNDFIQGGLGQDTLDGGTGIDTVDYTTFSGGGTYNLTNGTAVLTGAFTETMLNFENINTGAGNDTIYGSDFNSGNVYRDGRTVDVYKELKGGAGNDYIVGGTSFDNLFGEDGNDQLFGGAEKDYLSGGAGNDILNGGAGDDKFFFGGGAAISATNTLANAIGTDTIADFTQGSDKIVLNQNTLYSYNINGSIDFGVVANDAAAGASSAKIVYSQNTRNLIYNTSINGNTTSFVFATVNGLGGADLIATDFILVA